MGNTKSKKKRTATNGGGGGNKSGGASSYGGTTYEPPSSSTNTTNNAATSPSSTEPKSGKSDGFSVKKLEEVFNTYKESDEDHIGPTGMEKFCKDIAIEPEDVRMLVLAYHLEAKQMGFFSREEFMKGFQTLNADTVSKIKGLFKNFASDLEDQNKFKEIYKFAFSFAKDTEQKCLDMEMAKMLIGLLFGKRYAHTEPFLRFLGEQTTYKVLNIDQWMSLLEFARTVKSNFENYDENSAWPVLLDEYVEWSRDNQSS